MRKQYLLSRNSGTYTSPGTPDYQNVGEIQKGWCSERVPLPSTNKRHVGPSGLMPFNSGRALPSKWDDAERWITSPLSASGINKNVFVQPQRQPKSKSGPLGPQAVGCFSNYSPAVPVFQGGSVRDFTVGSPFSTGVLVPDCVQIHYGSSNGSVLANTMNHGNAIDRAASLPGCSDVLSESSMSKSQDDKFDGVKDVQTLVSRDISRRDMATQMSPRDSQSSSPVGRLSFFTSPPAADLHNNHSDRVEVKDLQIDNRASMTKQPVKNGVKKTKNDVADIKVVTSSWEITDASRNMSKLQREEAKISAWENLQKAKAEAAIQKLEMKLEKRRSASMDKILNRLRNAQLKAQDMRNTASNSCTYPRAKNSPKATFFRTFVRSGSLRGCSSCSAS